MNQIYLKNIYFVINFLGKTISFDPKKPENLVFTLYFQYVTPKIFFWMGGHAGSTGIYPVPGGKDPSPPTTVGRRAFFTPHDKLQKLSAGTRGGRRTSGPAVNQLFGSRKKKTIGERR